MAGKTPTDLIGELRTEIATLRAEFDSLQDELTRAEVFRIRERLAVLESLVAELKKREEENDRRRWQLQLGIAICVITFVANLTVNLLLFFVRK